MTPSRTDVRVIAWAVAILSVLATALTLILAFDLTGSPPVIPETADFPTRVLESQAFHQSRWPIDMAASLLFAGAFGAVVLLGALLSARSERPEISALLGAGGVLAIGGQLIHVGANQVAVTVGYCDCGFKAEEAISQAWGLMLAGGVSDWFLNGALILMAGGVLYAAKALAGRAMPATWGTVSWALAGLLVLGVALTVLRVDGPLPSLTIALASGIVLPIWAGWLALRETAAT